jgi:hypothetical protein
VRSPGGRHGAFLSEERQQRQRSSLVTPRRINCRTRSARRSSQCARRNSRARRHPWRGTPRTCRRSGPHHRKALRVRRGRPRGEGDPPGSLRPFRAALSNSLRQITKWAVINLGGGSYGGWATHDASEIEVARIAYDRPLPLNLQRGSATESEKCPCVRSTFTPGLSAEGTVRQPHTSRAASTTTQLSPPAHPREVGLQIAMQTPP